MEQTRTHTRPPLSDLDLIRRARIEDVSAYEQLVRRYCTPIYGMIYGVIGDADLAEDVLQVVFVRAWKALAHFRETSNFELWVFRIAMVRSFHAKRRKTSQKAPRLDEFGPEVKLSESYREYSQKGGLLRKLSLSEFQRAMESALDSCTLLSRMVLILHEIQEMPLDEIAKITGGKEIKAAERLTLARNAVREQLQTSLEVEKLNNEDLLNLLWMKRSEAPVADQIDNRIENTMRAVREAHGRPSLYFSPDKSIRWMFAQPRYGIAALFLIFLGLHLMDSPLPSSMDVADEPDPMVVDVEQLNNAPTNQVPGISVVHPSLVKAERIKARKNKKNRSEKSDRPSVSISTD